MKFAPGLSRLILLGIAASLPLVASAQRAGRNPLARQFAAGKLKYQTGKNTYQFPVDGVLRNFLIHVPPGYTGAKPVPLVLVIHGTNQGGNFMYDTSGWPRKADKEGFIAVFPSALNFDLVDASGTVTEKRVAKWNMVGLEDIVSRPQDIKDDVKFVRTVLAAVKKTFPINDNQVFVSGFSNGGEFVSSRLMMDMTSEFASYNTVCSGTNLGGATPRLPVSLLMIFGANDRKIAAALGRTSALPTEPAAIAADAGIGPPIAAVAAALRLNATYDVVTQANPSITTMVYDDSQIGAKNEFRFNMDANLGHKYPGYAADVAWDFFKSHPRGAVVPDSARTRPASRRPRRP